jgi:hypothetical protein
MGGRVLKTIELAKDFARYPFGRYTSDGPYSGERFRKEFLAKYLADKNETVRVVLDGALGLGSSFLEEAFGGLVRSGFDRTDLQRRIQIVSRDGTKSAEIARYISHASMDRIRA